MSLFKSTNERRLEREVEIRKGINLIRRNIRDLERHEKQYLAKAKRAKQLGSGEQLAVLKKAVRRSVAQRLFMEKQLLSIETASQIKNQAEAHAQFARAMTAVSRSIAAMFGDTDLARTQAAFEKAMARAETLEERMEIFLSSTSEAMDGIAESRGESAEKVVSDAEIDERIDQEIAAEESGEVDEEIRASLAEIDRELGRE